MIFTQTLNNGCFSQYELTRLEVFRGHQTLAHAGDLGDHDGNAVLAVAGPVLPLTLLATIGDGVTLGTLGQLLLPRHSNVTLVTASSVC